jgi:hypothetical protein
MNMKKYTRRALLVLALTLSIFSIAACGAAPAASVSQSDPVQIDAPVVAVETAEPAVESAIEPTEPGLVDAEEQPAVGADVVELPAVASGELTAAEAQDLLFMREEEKLARDVYLALYDRWGLNVFQNIASSESAHTQAVKGLLDQYGLNDPMAIDQRGVFTNPDLQALYDQLVAQGKGSLEDALRVGAAIEEIDILDLKEAMLASDHIEIQMVYDNLLKGSYNHLRAFVSTLNKQAGAVYQPQYLAAEDYQAIVSSGSGRGNGRG